MPEAYNGLSASIKPNFSLVSRGLAAFLHSVPRSATAIDAEFMEENERRLEICKKVTECL